MALAALSLVLAALSCSATRLDSILTVLDAELARAPEYRRQKEARLNALKAELRSPDGKLNFETAQELFGEYRAYQSDSALHYATLMRHAALQNDSRSQAALANAAFADYFITVGFFKEAAEMLAMTDSGDIPADRLEDFYNLSAKLYRSLCSYVGGRESMLWSYYNDLNRAYIDSILAVTPKNSYDYAFARIDRDQIDNPDENRAIDERLALLSRFALDDHEKAVNYSLLAHSLISAGRRDEAEYYTVLSAIHDIRSNTTETTAATMLAMMLHDDGRNEEAYKYIQKAQDDADFFNTRLRKYEISGYMPMIDRARVDWVSGQVWRLWAVVGVIFALLVLAVILFLMLRKKKNALELTNRELDDKSKEILESHEKLRMVNAQLGETYTKLQEATEIKDRYIMQSLYVNTAFVNHVEERCREVAKAVKEKKYDDLKFLPYQMGIKEERQRIFQNFDSAFLKLFPNFIDEYNRLFSDENKIVIERETELPMEVRIFALLRLGISDPAEVAAYLNLSTKTIYVYKTKAKSRSLVSNNEFEERIKAIPKP